MLTNIYFQYLFLLCDDNGISYFCTCRSAASSAHGGQAHAHAGSSHQPPHTEDDFGDMENILKILDTFAKMPIRHYTALYIIFENKPRDRLKMQHRADVARVEKVMEFMKLFERSYAKSYVKRSLNTPGE